jgi:hypothetical protein
MAALLYQEVGMSRSIDPVEHLRSLFATEPCWLIGPLADKLGYSIPSTRRFLSGAGYYSSFTHNAKWYTLASIPRFNHDGLWFNGQIGFSRDGSLTRALEGLAGRSPAGMTAAQLGVALRCRCHAVLAALHQRGRLQREKVGKSHLYMSAEPAIAAAQRAARSRLTAAPELPAEIAVLALAEFIRHPAATAALLSRALARSHRVRVAPGQIDKLFERHGIKKTTWTPGRRP